MDKSIVYLILLILFCSVKVNTQILISRCKICQRCTYCGDDVLYDCYIDDIYNNFIAKKQIIP